VTIYFVKVKASVVEGSLVEKFVVALQGLA